MVPLGDRIEEAFKRYDQTADLVKDFLSSRSNPQEFILLVCGRLDSFSNLAFTGKSQKDNFVGFLARHSGYRNTFAQIGLPDLYRYLDYHLWVLPGTIDKPGRLHMFDPKEDERFITFLWSSGLAIIQEEIGGLLKFIMKTLRERYRVSPTQSMRKSSLDSLGAVYEYLHDVAKRHKRGLYLEAVKSLRPILRDYSIGALLYRKYRNEIIHEYGVDVQEDEFFTKKTVYWGTFYNPDVYPTKFLQIQFPGEFLFKILVNCVRGYKMELKRTRKLPWGIFSDICNIMDEIDHLDDRSLPSGKDVVIQLR
jgi:hypothetical protein